MLARAARYARAGAAGAAPRPAPRPIFDPKAGTSPLRQLLAHRGAPELTALQKLTGAAGVVTAAGVGYVGWERAKVVCLPVSARGPDVDGQVYTPVLGLSFIGDGRGYARFAGREGL